MHGKHETREKERFTNRLKMRKKRIKEKKWSEKNKIQENFDMWNQKENWKGTCAVRTHTRSLKLIC